MIADDHREKAANIEATLAKLTVSDYEAIIEGAMLAGTHWVNSALHDLKLTEPASDVMHAQYLPGDLRLKISLAAPTMLDSLDEIEMMRPRFVRGNVAGGKQAAIRALSLLAAIRQVAASVPSNA